ncbi:hypothetical protein NP493_831g01026 [Ridgeia piscesae]|uniref:UspA domain-containing protein n=1 Tax=Ridgeia piscesae TaxID=27915 RepID=A0AAD9KMK5_RIDPI|nr:hypothetical protein NP493_831g01026 [Ridgeia piscesae]
MGGYMSSDVPAVSAKPGGGETVRATHNNNEGDKQTVLIPVDASKEAEIAFEWYVRHVHRPGNDVRIMHFGEIEYPSGKHYPDYAIPPEMWADKIAKAREHSNTVLDKYRQRVQQLQIDAHTSFELGRPGHSIVTQAKTLNASMIVMGTRGMGFLQRAMLGSVSNYVISHTSVPVTIVPRTTEV